MSEQDAPFGHRVLVVADGSGSARAHWTEVVDTISEILRLAAADVIVAVALLGTNHRWAPGMWNSRILLPVELPESSSFVGPIFAGLPGDMDYPDTVVIVGSGEIFDLADWLEIIPHWVLIKIGPDSLRPTNVRVRELSVEDLARLGDLLTESEQVRSHGCPLPKLSGVVEQDWRLDETGYPMVFVPHIDSYLQLFPIAKPQFESFLAHCTTLVNGDTWYRDLLKISPRLSPRTPDEGPYERLIATGLLFSEVEQVAQWYGPAYSILSVQQWRMSRKWLANQPMSVPSALLENQMARPALLLWESLFRVRSPTNLLDLSLMTQGVIEWVTDGEHHAVGMGDPRQSFYPGFHTNPFMPTSGLRRSKLWGSRLIRSKEASNG